tara:strand:- start:576 stop:899 length:324 start_codon:yes stop_codon:yes gene_type:complete
MNYEPLNRTLEQFNEMTRACVNAGEIPPAPINTAEYRAFEQNHPELMYLVRPIAEVGTGLLGELKPPFSAEWLEKFIATVIRNPIPIGRAILHAIEIARASQERPHE